MSQTFDESPMSDNKMDISESATTSQESTGVSPINENLNNEQLMSKTTTTNGTLLTTSLNNKECSVAAVENNTQQQQRQQQRQRNKFINNTTISKLSSTSSSSPSSKDHDENIKLDNDEMLELKQQFNLNMLRSELTVANSHPLMSPPGTDSDSENGYRRKFNFPDVIPVNEQQPPLRLANPVTSASINTPVPGSPLNDADDSSPDNKTKTTNNYKHQKNDETGQLLLPQKSCSSTQRRRPPSTSPDLLSSESSEQELSQYHANIVEPFNQSVTLIANNSGNRINGHHTKIIEKSLTKKKLPLTSEILSDDISSLDSISNHSFDDDIEPNLASISPTSSFMDDFADEHDEFDDDFCDLETPTNPTAATGALPSAAEQQLSSIMIPTYAAADERRDSRNWQKITLPDGRTREIDMRVIEPYKRVLSHGGYLKAGGHNAIVMFCACHLPDRSRTDYHYVMDNLFLYVVKTLEQLVTEDYVLVYLHGGCSRRNIPPFPWLKKCYQLLDRRLRKSLRNLYLVHPTFWLKSVVWMLRPFVSTKFWRKLVYVRTLEELYTLVSVEKTSIPDKVKNYDTKCQ